MATVTRENLSPNHLVLTLTLTRADVDAKLKPAFRNIQKNATVKGFRPGSAPEGLLLRMYGDQLFQEVFQNALGENLEKALEEIEYLGQPLPYNTEANSIVLPKSLKGVKDEYTVQYEVALAPELPTIRGIQHDVPMPYYVAEIDEAKIQAELDEIATATREWVDVEVYEEAVKNIEIVLIERENDPTSKAELAGLKTNLECEMLSPEFLKHFVGKRVGDTISVDIAKAGKNADLLSLTPYDETSEPKAVLPSGVYVCTIANMDKREDSPRETVLAKYFSTDDPETWHKLVRERHEQDNAQYSNAILFQDARTMLLKENHFDFPRDFYVRLVMATREEYKTEAQAGELFDLEYEQMRYNYLYERITEIADLKVTYGDMQNAITHQLRGIGLPPDSPIIANYVEQMMKDEKFVEKQGNEIMQAKAGQYIVDHIAKEEQRITKDALMEKYNSMAKRLEKEAEAREADYLRIAGSSVSLAEAMESDTANYTEFTDVTDSTRNEN